MKLVSFGLLILHLLNAAAAQEAATPSIPEEELAESLIVYVKTASGAACIVGYSLNCHPVYIEMHTMTVGPQFQLFPQRMVVRVVTFIMMTTESPSATSYPQEVTHTGISHSYKIVTHRKTDALPVTVWLESEAIIPRSR